MKHFYEVQVTYHVTEIREIMANDEDEAEALVVEQILDDPDVPSCVGAADIDVELVAPMDEVPPEFKEDREND